MAIIVSDTFDRADDPTSLGAADTGQTWSQAVSDPTYTFGVVSNTAKFEAASFVAPVSGQGWINALTEDAIVKVTLVNIESLPGSLAYAGVTARREDASRMYRLVFRRLDLTTWDLNFEGTLSPGVFNTLSNNSITPANGDTIALAMCGVDWIIYHNDVEIASGNTAIFNVHGTAFGIVTAQGPIGTNYSQSFNDFLVTTNGTCTPTYDCVEGACVDPEDGSGEFATLAACLESCEVAVSYNCVESECVDPGDGSGEFATLAECVDSGCGATTQTVETVRFDAGTGSSYYLVPPIVDSGDELRSKCLKPARVTSRRTNQSIQMYAWDVDSEINVSDLEDGLNSATGPLALDDNSNVSQSPLLGVNVPNASLHTMRIAGDDTGQSSRDRIDEGLYQLAQQGVRK